MVCADLKTPPHRPPSQGQQGGNSWIAKLPVEGLPAGSGFMTSTSPPCSHREAFIEDSHHQDTMGTTDVGVFFQGSRH